MQIQIPAHIPPHLAHVVRTYISGQRVTDSTPEVIADKKQTLAMQNAKIVEDMIAKMHGLFTASDLHEASNNTISYKTAYNHLQSMAKRGVIHHQKSGGRHFFAYRPEAQS